MGLTNKQKNILQAMTHELTRGTRKTRSDRPDKAEILIGGQSAKSKESLAVAPCPYLHDGERYVGFNGNGKGNKKHLRGRGYKLAVWMAKAGYVDPQEPITGKQVRAFLRDLAYLAGEFGLVIGCWHPKKMFWQSLEELAHQSSSSSGREFMKVGLFRVYTQDDFLVRWRQYFARKMGFSVIQAHDLEQPVVNQSPADSAEFLVTYLRKRGISRSELARQLGVSKPIVSYHLSGKRGWTEEWQKRIREWLGSEEKR